MTKIDATHRETTRKRPTSFPGFSPTRPTEWEGETPGNEVGKGGYFQYFMYLLGTDRLLRPRGGGSTIFEKV